MKFFNPKHEVLPPFEKRIEELRRLIHQADSILIGAGAGLSAAAGIDYGGKEFQEVFRPWIERYGITDLYSSSFYPFNTDEERWAYWAMHIWFARYKPQAMPLYGQLLKLVEQKDYFVITTNVDAQFEKAGFATSRIFATQGDYGYFQPASGQPRTLYNNREWVEQALPTIIDCRIPKELVPHVPESGEAVSMNLRCDETFVEDAHWHQQARQYSQFIERAQTKHLLLLELGVGFNTPGIIRFPFERMAATLPGASLVRLNRDDPQALLPGIRRFLTFTEPIEVTISQLSAG